MDRKHFALQIARLRSQWPQGYGEERLAIIFKLYERTPDDVFTEMVDLALGTYRSAPLLEEFAKLEQQVRNTRAQQRTTDSFSVGGFSRMLENAAAVNTTADREFVRACCQLVKDKNKYTPAQWEEAMGLLDQTARRLKRG